EDLGGAGAELVLEDDDGQVGGDAGLGGVALFAAVLVALRDDRALVEEHIGDADDGVEQAARVATQVEDYGLRPVRLDLVDRVLKLLGGAGRELADADVADAVYDLAAGVGHALRRRLGADTLDLDGRPGDRELFFLLGVGVADADGHLRALGPTDLGHGLFRVPALRRLAIDGEDDVAGLDAGGLSGRVLDGRHDDDVVALLGDGRPDALEGAAGRVCGLVGLGVQVVGAGVVEAVEEAVYRCLVEGLGVEVIRFYIIAIEDGDDVV